MKKLFMSQFAIGVVSVLAWSLLGTVPASQAATAVKFIATDEPGPWFKCTETTNPGELRGCVDAGSKSLAILRTRRHCPDRQWNRDHKRDNGQHQHGPHLHEPALPDRSGEHAL